MRADLLNGSCTNIFTDILVILFTIYLDCFNKTEMFILGPSASGLSFELSFSVPFIVGLLLVLLGKSYELLFIQSCLGLRLNTGLSSVVDVWEFIIWTLLGGQILAWREEIATPVNMVVNFRTRLSLVSLIVQSTRQFHVLERRDWATVNILRAAGTAPFSKESH